MNPRSPTASLTADETQRLRDLVIRRGERDAIRAVGLRSPEAFYKAVAGFPVSRMTVLVIRGSLDRI